MNKQRKAKRTGSKKAAANPRKKPSGPWNLRITPELRLSAQGFHDAMLRIHTREGGESPPPTIGSLDVRLKFQILLDGSRAAELVQMIGAASDGNLAADAERFNRLVWRLESLREQADNHENAASTTSSKRVCDKLLARIYQAQLQLDDLGEPPYRHSENDGTDELPDFMSIWRERERYITELAELEKVSRALRIDLNELEPKRPGAPRAIQGLAPLPTESSRNEVTVSVDDLLGGPLAGWVSEIGRSVSHTECLSMGLRWRKLADVYRELHLKSGLIDFEPIGIDGGWKNPLWGAARALLSQAQQHLLEFLKAARQADSPSSVNERVAKSEESRVSVPETKPPDEEKSDLKKVSVVRVGKCGSELEVLVGGKPLGNRTTTSKKVLLAACVLQFGPAIDGWWKTSRLMKLVLNKKEHGDLGERSAVLLNRWKGSLRLATAIDLETNESGRSFRLTGVEFDTRLSRRVIEAALSRFSEKCPFEIRQQRIDRA